MHQWGGFEYCGRLGRLLGAEVVKACETATPIDGSGFGWRTVPVAVPLKNRKEVEAFLRLMNITRPAARARFVGAETVETEVQVGNIGDVGVIALPGEPYAETRISLASILGSERLVTIGYANDDIRYIPPRDVALGGTYNFEGTPLAPGADHVLAEACVAAIRATR
jgi:hypothetical protein